MGKVLFQGVGTVDSPKAVYRFVSEGCVNILKERKPRNLVELAQMALQCLDAPNKKISTITTVARQNVKDKLFAGYGSQKDIMRCFACDGRGHRAVDCLRKASTS